MGTSLEDAYPPYGNLTHIVFPLETVQNYEDDSITWVMDGAFEVIYKLNQKGLPAWDKFIKDISLLLPLYDPPLSWSWVVILNKLKNLIVLGHFVPKPRDIFSNSNQIGGGKSPLLGQRAWCWAPIECIQN